MKCTEGLRLPSAIRIVKNILASYPDNEQILKELIQNAEDAGATEIKFLLDEGSYGRQMLFSPDMVQFQGPALYVYNNAEFTEEDWTGISQLNESVKEKDENTIGRFGVGFKSVFHMTDLPGVLSGNIIGLIDPHEKYLPSREDAGKKTSFQFWDILQQDHKEEICRYWDQFDPFFSTMFSPIADPFKPVPHTGKTLFRFPLRTVKSEISDVYNPELVQKNLFADLELEAHEILLFLTKLQCVEVYKRTAGQQQPEQVFLISKKKVQHDYSPTTPLIQVDIKVTKGQIDDRSTWFMYTYNNTTDDPAEIEKIRKDLCVAPNVSVALKKDPSLWNSKHSNSTLKAGGPVGRLFCFLPLPVEAESPTGLQVHINASFVIDPSRRNIMLPLPRDINTISDKKIIWNLHIIRQLIPIAMLHLTSGVAELYEHMYTYEQTNLKSEAVQAIYSIMPNLAQVKAQWQQVADAYYQLLLTEKNCQNLQVWYELEQNGNHKRITLDRRKLRKIMFDDLNDSDLITDTIRKLWKICKFTVISVPLHILSVVIKHGFAFACVNSVFNELKSPRITNGMLCDDDNRNFLQYLIKNIDVEDIEEYLIGTKLLPLNDGNWTYFRRAGSVQQQVFLQSPEHPATLLPGLDQYFVNADLLSSNRQIFKAFKHIADTGTKQLMNLSPSTVVRHLPLLNNVDTSSNLIVKNFTQPLTEEYLKHIWTYLQSNASLMYEIEQLQIHILPVDKEMKSLARLHKHMLINEPNLDSHLIECCRWLGIVVVDLPWFLHESKKLIGEYLLPLNPTNIINCMMMQENVIQNLEKADDCFKTAIRKYFGLRTHELQSLKVKQFSFLRKLPIFPTVDGSGFSPAHCVSTSEVSQATSNFNLKVYISEKIIAINEDESSNLLRNILKIKVIDPIHIVTTLIFQGVRDGTYSNEEQDRTMREVLSRYGNELEGPEYINFLKSLPFVRKLNGYAKPCDLYDPQDNNLLEIFQGKDVFVLGEFAKDEYRSLLFKLGLKGMRQLIIGNIIEYVQSAQPVETKSHVLMEVLEKMGEQFSTNANFKFFKDVLQKYCWVEAEKMRPPNYPATFKFESGYATPSDIYSYGYASFIGSELPTVKVDKWPALASLFGWNKEPSLEYIVKHLDNVMEWFQNRTYDDIAETVFLVRRLCEDIYRFMEIQLIKNSQLKESLIKLFKYPCIFLELDFVPVSRCVLSPEPGLRCLPWICSVSKSLTDSYENVFKSLGIGLMLDVEELLALLKEINDANDGVKLKVNDYEAVKCIIKFLGNYLDEKSDYTSEADHVYIPDELHILRPASNLYFNDYMAGPALADCSTEGYLCDLSIADKKTLECLGVRSKKQHILDSYLCPLPFGQTENLVTRINRLLNNTAFSTESTEIFKEFIQNADDAGATKIHFIIDHRQLPSINVFDEKWKSLQGPALCVFNDKPFAITDLQGIQDLGEGSKRMEARKIGKYGIGFNCVYHLTDVPMILTHVDGEKRFLAFDPTLKHIASASLEKPGCMYKNIDHLKQKIPDVFQGFLEEEYAHDYGTIFRLPFRLKKSEISHIIPHEDTMEKLFAMFKDIMDEYLLFLNNIREISLLRVCKKSEKTEMIYCSIAKMSSVNEVQRYEQFQLNCKSTAARFEGSQSSVSEVIYNLNVKTSDKDNILKKCTKWKVVQRLGFDEHEQLPQNIIQLYHDPQEKLQPHGGVAFRIAENSLSMLTHEKSSLHCFLPLPGKIDLPVSINGHFILDHETRRSLLKEETGGHKKGWNEYLMTNVIVPAYCTLICELHDDLDKKMKNDKRQSCTELELYLSAFPNVPHPSSKETFSSEKKIAVGFYKSIASQNVLPALRLDCNNEILWFNSSMGYFDLQPISRTLPPRFGKPKLVTNSHEEEERDLLRNILIRTGLVIIQSTHRLLQNFDSAGIAVKSVSPEGVLHFYAGKKAEIFPDQISVFEEIVIPSSDVGESPVLSLKLRAIEPIESVCRILRFCSQSENFKKNLLNTPLLVTEDGKISSFNSCDIKFLSKHSSVVPHAHDMFIRKDCALDAGLTTSKSDRDLMLCRPFTIQDFAGLLPSLLNTSIFKDSEKAFYLSELASVTDFFELKTRQLRNASNIQQQGNSQGRPQKSWICKVWKFMESEIERLWKVKGDSSKGTKKYELAESALLALHDWYLLPVCKVGKLGNPEDLLLPLGSFTWIMMEKYMRANVVPIELYNSLVKLGIPYVKDDSILIQFSETLLNLVVGEKNQPTSIYVIKGLIHLNGDLGEISEIEQVQLLHYLASTSKQWKELDLALYTLKKLPYYKTVTDNCVDLSGYREILIFPEKCNFPQTEVNFWMQADTVFLKYDCDIFPLIKVLGCRLLSEVDLYIEFILERFSCLSDDARYMHLDYIRNTFCQSWKVEINPESESGKILQKLRSTPILLNELTGHLAYISEFYNPRFDLFVLMEPEVQFPPLRYETDDWIEFFTKCGLVSAISCELLERYVHKVAELAKKNDMVIEKYRNSVVAKSNTLVEYIIRTIDQRSDWFCRQIKVIPFIFPHRLSDASHGLQKQFGYNDENGCLNCIAFEGSYPFSSCDYVWSVGNVLPECINIKDDLSAESLQMLSRLDIKLKIVQDVVVEHTLNICNTNRLEQSLRVKIYSNTGSELLRVLTKIYSFLHGIELSGKNCEILQKTPCIVIDEGNAVVFPHNVICEAHSEIRPYLFQLPVEFRQYSSLMKQIGVIQRPTVAMYAEVLASIGAASIHQLLDEEKTKSCMLACSGLLDQLATEIPDDSFHHEKLFLPGCHPEEMNREHPQVSLCESDQLIIRDKHNIDLKRMKDFQKKFFYYDAKYSTIFNLPLNAVSRLKKLPIKNRSKMLSDVVHEELVKTNENPVVCTGVENRLRSLEFRRGIVRLINHACHSNSNGPEMDTEELRQRLDLLNNLHIYVFSEMQTYLIDLSNNCEIENSAVGRMYFFDGKVVRIARTSDNSSDVLNARMSTVLNEITGNMLAEVRQCIAPIINCNSVSDINRCLDELDITKLDDAVEKKLFSECKPDHVSDEDADKDEEKDVTDYNQDSSEKRCSSSTNLWQEAVIDEATIDDTYDDLCNFTDEQRSQICQQWLRQATYDYECADKDADTAPEWSCYKCHQAAEKALKAVLKFKRIGVDGMQHPHDIMELAHRLDVTRNDLDFKKILQLAKALNLLLGRHYLMRYPGNGYPCVIPRQQYDHSKAQSSIEITQKIIQWSTEVTMP